MTEAGAGTKFPAPEVNAVDTTSAGDTFIGLFAAQMAARQTVEAAICAAGAAISIMRVGARPSITTLQEVDSAP